QLLLHMWSLSLEEQYYLLAPAALVALRPRRWLAVALIVMGGSLVLCLAFVSTRPGAVFYLLPTRAWELALGSMGALWVRCPPADKWLAAAVAPAVACVVALPFF